MLNRKIRNRGDDGSEFADYFNLSPHFNSAFILHKMIKNARKLNIPTLFIINCFYFFL